MKPTPKPKKPNVQRGAAYARGGDTEMFGKGDRTSLPLRIRPASRRQVSARKRQKTKPIRRRRVAADVPAASGRACPAGDDQQAGDRSRIGACFRRALAAGKTGPNRLLKEERKMPDYLTPADVQNFGSELVDLSQRAAMRCGGAAPAGARAAKR